MKLSHTFFLIAICLAGLYFTSPSHMTECQAEEVPSYCVD